MAKDTGKKNPSDEPGDAKRARRTSLFPASSFEEALLLANAIQKFGAGQKIRRLTLFDQIGKSPDSGPSRALVTNSAKYGLTKGSYKAEHMELTPEGHLATGTDVAPRDQAKARWELAIQSIAPFNALYTALRGNRLPAISVLEDTAKESGIPAEEAKECVETFVVNAKFVGVLRTLSGAERIVPIEQVLEDLPVQLPLTAEEDLPAQVPANGTPRTPTQKVTPKSDAADWDAICFYISPIGEDGSEHRRHADLFLGNIVEPALEEFGLKVVRADKIGKPGMITAQIIEHILRVKLVIADLSFHNPNVFYELCLRHVSRLPTVQIIRKADKIPFDMDQFRTIMIDTSDIYALVPNLQTYRTEIASQVRMALKDPDTADNPVTTFYPTLKVAF